MEKPTNRMLSVNDVARMIGFSKETTYKVLRTSGIPIYRINRRFVVRESDVLNWLENQKLHDQEVPDDVVE